MKTYIINLELKRRQNKTKNCKDGEKLLYATYRTRVSKDNLIKVFEIAKEMLLEDQQNLTQSKEGGE